MTLHLATAAYRFNGDSRLDVTRVGADRAVKAGLPAEGAFAAPSPAILWPAKAHLDLVEALDRRANALPPGEAAAFTALQAATLLARVEAAYRDAYLAGLRDSYRRQRPAWDALLAHDHVMAVCFCPQRESGQLQRHTCHRHHLAAALVACGAVDDGEVELPAPTTPAKPRAQVPLEALVAITGARPPKGGPREHMALHRAMLADVAAVVQALPRGTVVVHGGAEGVDATAGAAARRAGLAEIVVRPWYDAFGREAPLVRNAYVATAGRVLAWPAAWGSGTQKAVLLARAAGVEVTVREV